MNIKKDYIEKTKNYLLDLRMKLTKKEMLEEEIKILKKRQTLNGGIDFSELGFKAKKSNTCIDDLIITTDTKITNKEAQIDRINHDIRMFELYSRGLEKEEKRILELRYLKTNKKKSFSRIATDINYSKSTVADVHDKAVEKLSYYIFGEHATYM